MKIIRSFLFWGILFLCGCTNQIGVLQDFLKSLSDFNGQESKIITLHCDVEIDAIVVVAPYVTRLGLDGNEYTSKLNDASKKKIEDMASYQDNWLVFSFRNGRIIESATLPNSVMIDGSVLSIYGNGMFVFELMPNTRAWRPVEIRKVSRK